MRFKQPKPGYEAPYFRDLSQFSAAGQTVTPMGVCTPQGGLPYTNCSSGPTVAPTSCNPTGGSPLVAGCLPTGSFPEDPKCVLGSNALTGCKTGSIA